MAAAAKEGVSHKTSSLIGEVLGARYELEQIVGSGGFADVYRAMDRQLNRYVAIKVLQQTYAEWQDLRTRFEMEANVLSRINHPHIVNLIDFGVEGALPFLVMEFLRGETLRDLLNRGPIPWERTFNIA